MLSFVPMTLLAEGKNKEISEDMSDKRANTYWLQVESQHLDLEYGLNDRMAFFDSEGDSHYYEFPSDAHLKNGDNTAYVRYKLASTAQASIETGEGDAAQSPPTDPSKLAYVKVSLQAMNVDTRVSSVVELFTVTQNMKTGSFDKIFSSAISQSPISIKNENPGIGLVAIPEQGKSEGAQITFSLSDSFPILPYLSGQPLAITPQLELIVKRELEYLLAEYKKRNYPALVNAYEKSWGHIARSYDYGPTAKDYADSVDAAADITNPDYEFDLDYTDAKLRLEGDGHLVGYFPSPLVGKVSAGYIAIDFPVFFMLDADGNLKVGG